MYAYSEPGTNNTRDTFVRQVSVTVKLFNQAVGACGHIVDLTDNAVVESAS